MYCSYVGLVLTRGAVGFEFNSKRLLATIPTCPNRPLTPNLTSDSVITVQRKSPDLFSPRWPRIGTRGKVCDVWFYPSDGTTTLLHAGVREACVPLPTALNPEPLRSYI